MEPPRDQPPRRTKRPISGTAGEDGGGGSSSRDDTGFLDERGSFVERAARGGTKEEAWLGPDDADAPAAAARATKRAGKVLRKQEEDERLVDDLVSARAVFEIRKRIVGLLWPGETVPRALRRLKESGQAEGRFPGAASTSTGAGTRGSSGRMDEATQRAFDELTDAAAELMDSGYLDAYSDDREAFERAAWVYEYGRRRRASASAAQEAQGEYYEAECTAAAATVDMFGDDGVDAGGTGAKTAADSAGGQAVDPDQPEAAAGEGTGVAGWDYVYDPASGYYYSNSTGYYYDAASGCYGSASTGTWFTYDDDDDDDNGQCSSAGKEMQG